MFNTQGMEEPLWKILIHDDFDYREFLISLGSPSALEVSSRLEKILAFQNPTLVPPEWIKPLGSGLFEFRIRANGVLVRIFFSYQKGRIILLLGGYDKLRNPSRKRQNAEIALARRRKNRL